MLIQADAADELLDSDPGRAHRALQHVHLTGRGAMREARRLLDSIRDPGRDTNNVVVGSATDAVGADRITGLVDAVRGKGLPVSLTIIGDLDRVGKSPP